MDSIVQCLYNYYPFVATQIENVKKYNHVIFTLRDGSLKGNIEQYRVKSIYSAYSDDISVPQFMLNRLVRKLTGVPWIFHRAVKKESIKLMHAHFGPRAIQFLSIALRLNLPLLTSFYGYDVSAFPRIQTNREQLKILFQYGTAFTAMSGNMARELEKLGCPSDKLMIHHTSVEIDKFTFSPPEYNGKDFNLLCVCQYVEKKGLSYLIKAFAKVSEKYPEAKLRIVGRPIKANYVSMELDSLIQELGIVSKVLQLGPVPYNQLQEEYKKAHLFALASHTASDGGAEGIPTVLLEAQATGLPVISTRHAGIPEAILDGKSGFIVPEKDDNALAEKMIWFLEHPDKWKEMGKSGREFVEREYNALIQAKKLEDIYTKLITKYNHK